MNLRRLQHSGTLPQRLFWLQGHASGILFHDTVYCSMVAHYSLDIYLNHKKINKKFQKSYLSDKNPTLLRIG